MDSGLHRPPRWTAFLLAVILGTSACAGLDLFRPRPTPAATPVSVSPLAWITPAPTARPLAGVVSEPGIYRNDVVGVSLEYPPDWEVLNADGANGELLVLRSADEAVVVSLTTSFLLPDENLKTAAADYYGRLPSVLGLSAGRPVSSDPGFRLADDTPAWRAVGEGQDPNGDWLRFDVVAAERSGRAFFLTLLAYAGDYQDRSATLDAIRQSLQLYPPRPYGVDRSNALFLADEEPETFDPALWRGSADGMIGDLFSGLVQLDANLRPIPDLAERWEVTPDGTRYTFFLRRGVVFHNGDPFTARDVIFSWERAARPETGSDTVLTYLGDIVGVHEVAAGQAEHISGLRLIDDYTLQVTLDGSKAYFLAKLAYPTSWIVDPTTVDRIEEEPIGTGPFMLAQHIENQVVIMARNPYYHRGPVPLEYIVYLLYPGPLVRLYEAGDIDVTYIDEDLLPRANDPQDPLYGTVQATSELCTWYVVLDSTRPPFDDPLVRQAFATAIDREQYVSIVSGGTGVVANGLYPPGLPGYNPDLQPLPYDPARARDLLRESSYGGPEGLPEIVFTASGAGGDLSPSVALLLQMWQETLGVRPRVEQIDSRSFYDQVYAGNHGQLLLTGWCADYPDPENFADVLFHSGSPQNFGGYANPALDALLEQARVEGEVDRRLALYQEVEQRMVNDAAAIFLQHSQVYYTVVKPYVQAFISTPIGIAQHMNLSIAR
ncbi:MAG: peptide ABC transporter substrate-binding protein [Chloroflexota bacterium]